MNAEVFGDEWKAKGAYVRLVVEACVCSITACVMAAQGRWRCSSPRIARHCFNGQQGNTASRFKS